jgi:hypothetical protein
MTALNLDTGKPSFHIRNLAIFLEQTPTGKYKLSKIGENAIRLIKDLEAWSVEAEVAKKASAFPYATLRARFREKDTCFSARLLPHACDCGSYNFA